MKYSVSVIKGHIARILSVPDNVSPERAHGTVPAFPRYVPLSLAKTAHVPSEVDLDGRLVFDYGKRKTSSVIPNHQGGETSYESRIRAIGR